MRFAAICSFAYASPAGQKPFTSCTSTEKAGVYASIATSNPGDGRACTIEKYGWKRVN